MVPTLRPADAADAAFLLRMLVAAVAWRPGTVAPSADDVLAAPELAHYVAGWPRTDDLGVVADVEGRPVGAAWLRHFPADDPGYGFVDPAVPELSVGVEPDWRGRGVGTRLIEALLHAAGAAGVTAVSLSVEPQNPALRLYERLGFARVGGTGGSLTLVRRLGPPSEPV